MVELSDLTSFANPARLLATGYFEAILIVIDVFVSSVGQLYENEWKRLDASKDRGGKESK